MATFNANDYNTVPTINAASTVALTRRLVAEMPAALADNSSIAVPADRMRLRANTLRAERLKALQRPATVDTRPFDQGEDSAWGALHDRLEGYARLDPERVADAGRAAALLASVFPGGLAFLTLDYKQQWEESERLLQLIDTKEWGSELDRLCHSSFLAEVRHAHQAYGDALGLTQAKPILPEAPTIAGALQALRQAIRFYARRVVALADEEDPASLQLVQSALAPIVEAQADARARRAQGQPEPEPPDEGDLPPLTP